MGYGLKAHILLSWLDFYCYMLACRVKMSRQAEIILIITYHVNSARQPAHDSVAALQLFSEYFMKIHTTDEYRSALLRIERLFDVNDPESKEGKELSSLIEAVEEYEEDQELISIVRERINQPEVLTKLDDL